MQTTLIESQLESTPQAFRWKNYRNWIVLVSLAIECVQLVLFPINTLRMHNAPQGENDTNTTAINNNYLNNVVYLTFQNYSVDISFWTSFALAGILLLCVCIQILIDTYTYAKDQNGPFEPESEHEEPKPEPEEICVSPDGDVEDDAEKLYTPYQAEASAFQEVDRAHPHISSPRSTLQIADIAQPIVFPSSAHVPPPPPPPPMAAPSAPALSSVYLKNMSGDKIAQVNLKVEQVKDVMHANIEKVLQRGENIESLVEKSVQLEQAAAQFRMSSTKLKRHMRRKRLMRICCCPCWCLCLLYEYMMGKGPSIDNIFGDLEFTSTRIGRLLFWTTNSCPLVLTGIILPVLTMLTLVLSLVLTIPSLFWLLLLRTTKIETVADAMTERLEVISQETAARKFFRLIGVMFRSLPLAFILSGSPFVFFIMILPEKPDQQGAVFSFVATHVIFVSLFQILGTLRAVASHDAIKAKPVPKVANTPEEKFHKTFYGSLMYGHGKVVNAKKIIVSIVSLFGDTLFFNIITNLLVPISCFPPEPWHATENNNHIPSTSSNNSCFSTSYERLRAACGLAIFGLYVPVCVMLSPSLSESDPELKDIHFAKYHTMTVCVIKVLVMLSQVLFPSPEVFLTIIGVLYVILAVCTLRPALKSETLTEPSDRSYVNFARVATFSGSAFACSISLSWHGLEKDVQDPLLPGVTWLIVVVWFVVLLFLWKRHEQPLS